jgi:osmotically inducible protein OsmC
MLKANRTTRGTTMATRNGSARWNGDLAGGSGTVTIGEGAWTGSYSFGSRFEDGAGTNPEELIAAAHAGCFSMALSHILTEAGHTPRSVETKAQVHLRLVDGAPTIQQIDLETTGDVPDLDEQRFHEFAEEAKRTCVVSRALGGVEEMNVTAALAAVAARG